MALLQLVVDVLKDLRAGRRYTPGELATLCAERGASLTEVLQLLNPPQAPATRGETPPPPQRFGHYTLGPDPVLGKGGVGTVYAGVEDGRPEAPVAIKVLQQEHANDDTVRTLFLREAIITALLKGIDGVTEVLTVGSEAGWTYIVYGRVQGQTLSDYTQGRALAAEEAVRILAGVCEVVEAAHVRGVLHRDLKPDNIVITPEGRLHVLDWGVAALEGALGSALRVRVGTRGYWSPEQAEGRFAGAPSEVYSLGVILYVLLTGRPAEDVVGQRDQSGSLEARVGDPRLAGIIRKATSELPQGRHQTVGEFLDDLEEWLRQESGGCTIELSRCRPILPPDATRKPVDHAGSPGTLYYLDRSGRLVSLSHRYLTPLLNEGSSSSSPYRLDLAEVVYRCQEDRPDAPLIFHDYANRLSSRGETVPSLVWYERALTGFESGPQTKPFREAHAACLCDYGRVLWWLERGMEAIPVFAKCVALRKRVYGPKDYLTNEARNNLAEAYRKVGDFRRARATHRKCQRVAAELVDKETIGEDDVFHAFHSNNWARMEFAADRFETAEAFSRQALTHMGSLLGEEHPYTTFPLNTLGMILDKLGRHDEAVPVIEESLDRRVRHFGLLHPYSLFTRNLLVESHIVHREWKEAREACDVFLGLPLDSVSMPALLGVVNAQRACGEVIEPEWRLKGCSVWAEALCRVLRVPFTLDERKRFRRAELPQWITIVEP